MIPTLFALLLQAATPPVCTQTAPPPAGLEAWTATPEAAADAILIGKPTALTLQPAEKVAFAPALTRPAKPGTFGGVYHLAVPAAGTYRIALSAGAWIDVARDGKLLRSVAHVEGAPCAAVRKIVDFALEPGDYALQLSGARQAEAQILVTPK